MQYTIVYEEITRYTVVISANSIEQAIQSMRDCGTGIATYVDDKTLPFRVVSVNPACEEN